MRRVRPGLKKKKKKKKKELRLDSTVWVLFVLSYAS